MDILIIGGTKFVGPALVDAARRRGHRLTLFNRGLTAGGAPPGVETIIGDRETDLERLQGWRWDAVIDTCGYAPRIVALSAEALRGAADHYTFISTLSVYPPAGAPNRDEAAPVLTLEDESTEEVTGETYGPLKALCEAEVAARFPGQSAMIRCGLIVGPRDPSNRFTYWAARAGRGGLAIAPPREQPVQFIDARDLAEFVLAGVEAGRRGVFNVTGPARRLTFGQLLASAKSALGSDVEFQHVSDEFLRARDVGEFMELPLWLNHDLAESFMTFSIEKALGSGLRFRPLEETVLDTYEWWRGQAEAAEGRAGLAPDRERALLAATRPR